MKVDLEPADLNAISAALRGFQSQIDGVLIRLAQQVQLAQAPPASDNATPAAQPAPAAPTPS